MYDDYDLDYTCTPEYEYDLDEIYDAWVQTRSQQLDEDLDLDEDYAHNTQDYDALAYRHYAWYNLVHTHTTIMHAHTLAQKRTVRVTLDVECYDDLNLEDLEWKDLIGLEGDESVYATIKEVEPLW